MNWLLRRISELDVGPSVVTHHSGKASALIVFGEAVEECAFKRAVLEGVVASGRYILPLTTVYGVSQRDIKNLRN